MQVLRRQADKISVGFVCAVCDVMETSVSIQSDEECFLVTNVQGTEVILQGIYGLFKSTEP